MYLKNLEINGFKSFAKKSELAFKTPITAIVGPNGSGKSNVAEAFRFVLGEQSLKSMRGKKGEDMIWNGSNDAGRANRASVKIVFDNTRRFLNLDFDEVSVERTVFRDGVNEYSINGSRVRLKDVLELLAAAHIGASGHHIISQGEADRILNANAKDRKAIIEDALGLKVYQYKKEESERKLTKTEENIKSVESLRREIAPHIKFLKKQVEKVEKAIELKERLAVLYKEYLGRESSYLRSSRDKIQEESRPIEKQLSQIDSDLKVAKEILSRSESHDNKSDRVIELEEKIRETRNKKDGLVRELGRVEGQIAAEERILKVSRGSQDLAGAGVSVEEIERFVAEINDGFEAALKEENISGVRKILESLKGLISSFLSRRRKGNGSSEKDSRNQISVLQAKKTEIEGQIGELNNLENDVNRQYADLRREIDNEKDTNRETEKRVFELMSTQNEVLAKKNLIRAKSESLDLEEADFKRELGEAAAIVGREVLSYTEYEISGQAEESRQFQHDRRREIEKIKIRLEESGVGSSADIMKEFQEVSERDTFLARELEDLNKSSDSLRLLIDDFSQRISTEFSAGLEKINKQFEEFFSAMFGGGTAKLALVKDKKNRVIGDELDFVETQEESVVEEGIEVSINLPRKKIKSLMMLSGGERALTSIALIFAMSQVKPPPFIILDETDAALDEANSKKYGDMIESLAKYSQLILITHNRETMSRAGVLYGVTMLSGVSKLLSIQFEDAVTVAK